MDVGSKSLFKTENEMAIGVRWLQNQFWKCSIFLSVLDLTCIFMTTAHKFKNPKNNWSALYIDNNGRDWFGNCGKMQPFQLYWFIKDKRSTAIRPTVEIWLIEAPLQSSVSQVHVLQSIPPIVWNEIVKFKLLWISLQNKDNCWPAGQPN